MGGCTATFKRAFNNIPSTEPCIRQARMHSPPFTRVRRGGIVWRSEHGKSGRNQYGGGRRVASVSQGAEVVAVEIGEHDGTTRTGGAVCPHCVVVSTPEDNGKVVGAVKVAQQRSRGRNGHLPSLATRGPRRGVHTRCLGRVFNHHCQTASGKRIKPKRVLHSGHEAHGCTRRPRWWAEVDPNARRERCLQAAAPAVVGMRRFEIAGRKKQREVPFSKSQRTAAAQQPRLSGAHLTPLSIMI